MLAKSPRVTVRLNDTATSAAWNDFVLVNVDGTFSQHIKCIKCDVLLKWKHRDGTSGLTNHSKACVKNTTKGAGNRKLTDLASFASTKQPDRVIPAHVNLKSEVADAVVLICATDVR
jgi:hypothetical protein